MNGVWRDPLLERKNEGWEEGSREAKSSVSSRLSVAYHEVSVIQSRDRKGLVQTKAQGRTKTVTVSIVPAIVSMTFNAHAIQRDVACVHEVSHIVLLIDVD
jgi:hypothetical protein